MWTRQVSRKKATKTTRLKIICVDWSWHELIWCLLVYIITAVVSYGLQTRHGWHASPNIVDVSKPRILFITAHPDDECMFFAPTILSYTESNPTDVYLLCLTRGDYRNEGNVRTKELWKSCTRLGIPAQNVTMLDNSFFSDDPSMRWDTARLAHLIQTHIETLDIRVVATFDEDGVSGHANHKALYRAVLYLASRNKLPTGCHAFALESVNVFRKYTSMLDVLPALLFDRRLHIASPVRFLRGCRAMQAHRSQMLWFRKLYLITSRYMLVNTFSEIADDFSLESSG